MKFFAESRLVFEGGAPQKVETPKTSQPIPADMVSGEKPEKASVVDIDFAELFRQNPGLDALKLQIEQQGVLPKLAALGELTLTSGFDRQAINDLVKEALVKKNVSETQAIEMASAFSYILDAKVREHPVLKNLSAQAGSDIEQLLEIKIFADQSNKLLKVRIEPKKEVQAALNTLSAVQEGVEKQKVDLAGVVDEISANQIFLTQIIAFLNTQKDRKLADVPVLVEKALAAKIDLAGVCTYAPVRAAGVFGAQVLPNGMPNVAAQGKFTEYKSVLLSQLKAAVLAGMSGSFEEQRRDWNVISGMSKDKDAVGVQDVRLENGQILVNIADAEKFTKSYDNAQANLSVQDEEMKTAITGAKKGVFGWILKTFFGVEDKDWVEIVNNEHPLSYFFGILSVASGGQVYAWAKPRGEEALGFLEGSPRLKQNVGSIMKLARSALPFVPEAKNNPMLLAKSIEPSVFKVNLLSGKPYKIEEAKGILVQDYSLEGGKLKLELGEGHEVRFGQNFSGITKQGTAVQMEGGILKAPGTYMVEVAALPPTYFSNGVVVSHLKASATVDPGVARNSDKKDTGA